MATHSAACSRIVTGVWRAAGVTEVDIEAPSKSSKLILIPYMEFGRKCICRMEQKIPVYKQIVTPEVSPAGISRQSLLFVINYLDELSRITDLYTYIAIIFSSLYIR